MSTTSLSDLNALLTDIQTHLAQGQALQQRVAGALAAVTDGSSAVNLVTQQVLAQAAQQLAQLSVAALNSLSQQPATNTTIVIPTP